MKYYEISIETTHDFTDIVSEILIDNGSEGTAIQDSRDIAELISSGKHWDYIDDGLLAESENENTVIVKGFYSDLNVVSKIEKELNHLKAADSDCGTLKISYKLLDDSDYENEWKKYFSPIIIGKIVVVPEWLDNPDKSKLPVFIDPGAAFGTGWHATTKMCINLMQEIELSGKELLDIGCGSGILSIAGLRLGAKSACLIDIDENAVKVSRDNLKLNALENKAEFITGNLTEKISKKFDIITANLTADILIELNKSLLHFINPDGFCIVSGIIDSRLKEMTECFNKNFNIVKQTNQDEWNAMILSLKFKTV